MLGLALSGGGARGAFQVGFYEVLLADSRFAAGPGVVSGTSAGAINAALIASGKSPAEMLAFWHRLADDPPIDASDRFARDFTTAVRALVRRVRPGSALRTWLGLARRSLSPAAATKAALELLFIDRFDIAKAFLADVQSAALFDTRRLRKRLVETLGGDTVRPTNGRKLAVQAVDAHAGVGVRYVAQADRTRMTTTKSYALVPAITVDMILASASIPILFPAVEVERRIIWDGGVLNNTPLAPLVDLGAKQVITVLVTEARDGRHNRFDNLGDAIERAIDTLLDNTYNVDRKLMLERNKLPGYERVDLYKAVRPAYSDAFTIGSYLDFNRAAIDAMADEGRKAARTWLDAGPALDSLDAPNPL